MRIECRGCGLVADITLIEDSNTGNDIVICPACGDDLDEEYDTYEDEDC